MPITDMPFIPELVQLLEDMNHFLYLIDEDSHGESMNSYREEYRNTIQYLRARYTALCQEINRVANDEETPTIYCDPAYPIDPDGLLPAGTLVLSASITHQPDTPPRRNNPEHGLDNEPSTNVGSDR